jgi:hypothetical protein
MTRLKLILLLGILTNSLIGQSLNYRDYRANNQKVFSKIDSKYINLLKELGIRNLTESRTVFDTLGNIKDNSIVYFFDFDSAGRISEHRYDYRLKSTKYRSTQYTYLQDGTMTLEYFDPFGKDALSGAYIPGWFTMQCEYWSDSYQIEIIEASYHGKIFTMRYYYNEDLFVENYFGRSYLISGLDFLENDKLVYSHKIIYEK